MTRGLVQSFPIDPLYGGTYYVGNADETSYFSFDGIRVTWKAANTSLDASGNLTATSAVLSGSITASSGAIGGWVVTADAMKDAAGTVGMSSAVTAGDDIRFWAGHATPSSAPFYVTEAGALVATSATITGAITATSGAIASWNISGTTLTSTNGGNTVTIDSANTNAIIAGTTGSPQFIVTHAGAITATSGTVGGNALTATTIESTVFTSGVTGVGWQIQNNGTAEFANIYARGMIRTAVFQKDVISVVGGTVMVLPADVLATDMTALDSSTLTVETETGWSVGDVLRIKDGTYDEWLEISGVGNAPIYDVDRDKNTDYDPNDNPVWKKGASVVNYQQNTDGGVKLTSSEDNAPHVDIFTHTGTPWPKGAGVTTHARFGNLGGFLSQTDGTYGIAMGDATHYLIWDGSTLNVAGHALVGSLTVSTNGYIASGQTAYDTGTGFWMEYNGGTPRFSLGAAAGNKMTWDGSTLTIAGEGSGITSISGGNITAGTVTATKLVAAQRIVASSRTQLFGYGGNDGLIDPDFQQYGATTDWTAATYGWGRTNAYTTMGSTVGIGGTYGLKIETGTSNAESNRVAITSGQSYYAEAYVELASFNGRVKCYVEFRNSGGSYISASTQYDYTTTGAESIDWTLHTFSGTAPADSATMDIVFEVTAYTSGSVRLDNCKMVNATTYTTSEIVITPAELVGYGTTGARQFYLGATDGKAYAGGGAVVLDSNGITITESDESSAWLIFNNGTSDVGWIYLGSGDVLTVESNLAVTLRSTLNGGDVTLAWSSTGSTTYAVSGYEGSFCPTSVSVPDLGSTANPWGSLITQGNIYMDGANSHIRMLERAAPPGNSAGYGYLWVKNTTPSELWFTADDGTDTKIA